MTFGRRRNAALGLALVFGAAVGAETVEAPKNEIERWRLAPFWEGREMLGESLFFLEPEAGSPATSTLLFTPESIQEVLHPATGERFEEGRDYTVDPATRTLTL